MPESKIPLYKYSMLFTAAYLLISLLVLLADILLHFQGGIGTSFATLVGAVLLVMNRFVQQHQRLPDFRERWVLVGQSLIGCLLASLLQVLIFAKGLASPGQMQEIQSLLAEATLAYWLISLMCFAILYLLNLYIAYGWLSSLVFRAKVSPN
ncbi:ABZJ_00895 family protein [Parachitinimonas caeni]|uniref:ABZJ_00895 family protein n=1 Tax=Parachitinimonas caeni TaxID=3031301 RepID=A0ABT7E372_9NEIS|nr:ABZJ_00895 family protein [Parachitinimonas caeni]MDK2126748.1 ABZJ_00895 family protein [Parachitinimonas caeni]